MKKVLVSLLFVSLISTSALCIEDDTVYEDAVAVTEECELSNSRFRTALSAGYVFKYNDTLFREVYGLGMGNIITADGSCSIWESWAIGTKISYWLAIGKTTAFNRRTFLQEVPWTFYLCKIFNLKGCVQWYFSLGGGVAWIKEESYLGNKHQWRGIGEIELGVSYPVWRCLDLTSAFRYLFPRQKQGSTNADIGGFDLRAGLGYSF